MRRLVAYLNAMISDALRFRGHRMAAEIGQREMLALISASERYLPAPMTSGAKRWPGFAPMRPEGPEIEIAAITWPEALRIGAEMEQTPSSRSLIESAQPRLRTVASLAAENFA